MINNAQRMLGILLHAPRGPFYSPKAARSRLRTFQEGNSCLLSTGAPDSPVHHQTLSGADFFPVLAQPTVGDLELLAHRTVRCPLQTVGSATRHTRIARPTVGSPDSPVHIGQSGAHRTVRWILAVRRRRIPESGLFTRASLAHRTLSGAPPDSPLLPDWTVFGWTKSSLFQIDFSCFQYLDKYVSTQKPMY
jgi:hypothetical protein